MKFFLVSAALLAAGGSTVAVSALGEWTCTDGQECDASTSVAADLGEYAASVAGNTNSVGTCEYYCEKVDGCTAAYWGATASSSLACSLWAECNPTAADTFQHTVCFPAADVATAKTTTAIKTSLRSTTTTTTAAAGPAKTTTTKAAGPAKTTTTIKLAAADDSNVATETTVNEDGAMSVSMTNDDGNGYQTRTYTYSTGKDLFTVPCDGTLTSVEALTTIWNAAGGGSIKLYTQHNGANIDDGTWIHATVEPNPGSLRWRAVSTDVAVQAGDTLGAYHTSLQTNRLYYGGVLLADTTQAVGRMNITCAAPPAPPQMLTVVMTNDDSAGATKSSYTFNTGSVFTAPCNGDLVGVDVLTSIYDGSSGTIKAYTSINGTGVDAGQWIHGVDVESPNSVLWRAVPMTDDVAVAYGDTLGVYHTSLDTSRLYSGGVLSADGTQAVGRMTFRCPVAAIAAL